MAFTLAHPAAVIPLTRLFKGRVVTSALVIGSMVPDLPRFVPCGVTRADSHSLLGVLLFSVPAGLVLLSVFHRWIKRPLIQTLPPNIQNALMPYSDLYWLFPHYRISAVFVSLVLGVLTHLAWDEFTHHHTFLVTHVAILRASLVEIGGLHLRTYKFIQYASSVAGLFFLGVQAQSWLRSALCESKRRGPLVEKSTICDPGIAIIAPDVPRVGISLVRLQSRRQHSPRNCGLGSPFRHYHVD